MVQWKVQIFGERHSDSWEISIVRLDNELGQKSWGWFNDQKLLVNHNGGPCHWPISGMVFDDAIRTAEKICGMLNGGNSLEDIEYMPENAKERQ